MFLINLLSLQLMVGAALVDNNNCALLKPPKDAGETQAHGVILYIHPRSHTINKKGYTGCQNQWFLDDDIFRKLSVIHYKNGNAVSYENINLHGNVGYSCQYNAEKLVENSEKRCPDYEALQKKTYQAGCYSSSKLNNSQKYDVYSKDCQFK